MSKELKLQKDIKDSVITDGGYSVKLSNRFTMGIPDLLIVLNPWAPAICEVKDLGVVTDNFDQKLEVTPLQRNTMKQIEEAYGEVPLKHSTFVLCGMIWGKQHWLVGLPWYSERVTAAHLQDPLRAGKRQKGGYYDLAPIMKSLNMGLKQ